MIIELRYLNLLVKCMLFSFLFCLKSDSRSVCFSAIGEREEEKNIAPVFEFWFLMQMCICCLNFDEWSWIVCTVSFNLLRVSNRKVPSLMHSLVLVDFRLLCCKERYLYCCFALFS